MFSDTRPRLMALFKANPDLLTIDFAYRGRKGNGTVTRQGPQAHLDHRAYQRQALDHHLVFPKYA